VYNRTGEAYCRGLGPAASSRGERPYANGRPDAISEEIDPRCGSGLAVTDCCLAGSHRNLFAILVCKHRRLVKSSVWSEHARLAT